MILTTINQIRNAFLTMNPARVPTTINYIKYKNGYCKNIQTTINNNGAD